VGEAWCNQGPGWSLLARQVERDDDTRQRKEVVIDMAGVEERKIVLQREELVWIV
jgi:hypothetical protein